MRHIRCALLTISLSLFTSCTQLSAEPVVVTMVVPYGSNSTPTPLVPTTQIMGATKSKVDALLNDWSVRADRTSTSETAIYRYTQDVTLIIAFRNDQAIGVYVIDNPGAGVVGITPARADELVTLIGGTIAPDSLVVDEAGFREFGIGDITSW
jgi:hypothetical protein